MSRPFELEDEPPAGVVAPPPAFDELPQAASAVTAAATTATAPIHDLILVNVLSLHWETNGARIRDESTPSTAGALERERIHPNGAHPYPVQTADQRSTV